MPILAVPEPDHFPPRVRIDISWSGHETATVLRRDPDGRSRPVRLAEPATLTGGTWVGFDYEAPFGAPIRYSMVDGASREATSPLQLLVDVPWLRHPNVPSLSVRLDVLDASSFASRTRAAPRRGVFTPLGSDLPVVVTMGRRPAPQDEIVVRTQTLAELDALRALVDDGGTLLLSIPPERGWGVTHEYVAVGDVVEQRVVDIGAYPTRNVRMPYLTTGRPAGDLQAQWTYNDLNEFASLEALSDHFASYNDMTTNTRRVEPELEQVTGAWDTDIHTDVH